MRQYRRSMRRRRSSARRRRRSRGVTGDIGAEFRAISAIAEIVKLSRCVTELLIMEIRVLFPNLRQANVTPIPKGPQSSSVANY